MSTAGRPDASTPPASDVATQLREAAFVRLVAAADGDAVAALGLVAGALDAVDAPYQATVAPLPDGAERTTDADLTVAFGRPTAAADIAVGLGGPASPTAYEAASELGEPDPVLALAGTVAACGIPNGAALTDAEAAGLDRRPGIAAPTADVADALAHSTLVHGPFSGDAEAASELVPDEASTDDVNRRLASLVALAVAGDDQSTPRAADAVERFLRPYVGGPFETVGGYADVLDAVARTRPGLGVALGLGRTDPDTALDAWREHGRTVHTAVRSATTGRYDGLFVVRCEDPTPVGTVARLVRDFRSPEPLVLAVAEGDAAVLRSAEADADVGSLVRDAAGIVGGKGDGTRTCGRARFDADATEFVTAVREAR